MLASQVTHCFQVSLFGQSETVESRGITLIVFVVFLQEETIALMDSKVDLFLEAEDGVDPVAVVHVHRVKEIWFDHIVVDLGRLTHVLPALASVLIDVFVRGGVDHVTLHLAELSW